MKICLLTLSLLCFIMVVSKSEIINAYNREVAALINQKERLTIKISQNQTEKSRRKTSKEIIRINRKLNKIQKYQTITDSILYMLKVVDPELYNQASNVKSACGQNADVYVKVLNINSPEFRKICSGVLLGYTNLAHWAKNPNVPASEYGLNSMSVIIGDGRNQLFTLAHELAHAIYQIENLADYSIYYERVYSEYAIYKFGAGHFPSDPGLDFVKKIDHDFKLKYKEYISNDIQSLARRRNEQ